MSSKETMMDEMHYNKTQISKWEEGAKTKKLDQRKPNVGVSALLMTSLRRV